MSVNRDLLPKDKKLLPKEGEEQVKLFNWAEMHMWEYPELKMMYHTPNGGKRSKSEAARLKKEGVKAGVPDIFLAVPKGGYHGLYIELKRLAGGRPSKEQQDWVFDLKEQGYAAEFCKGWEEAAETIRKYLDR